MKTVLMIFTVLMVTQVRAADSTSHFTPEYLAKVEAERSAEKERQKTSAELRAEHERHMKRLTRTDRLVRD